MEPSTPNNPPVPAPAPAIDRELLITRLLDARASDADWLAFRDFAAVDQSVWNDIVATRRDMLHLERGFGPITAAAERSEMPELRFTNRPPTGRGHWHARSGLIGWAVAAVLALGFVAQQAGFRTGMERAPQASLVPTPRSAPELLEQYIEAGRKTGMVLGEAPQRMVVETRPREEGKGHEVLFYRLLLERTFVKDFQTMGSKEDGESVLVPASPPLMIKTSY